MSCRALEIYRDRKAVYSYYTMRIQFMPGLYYTQKLDSRGWFYNFFDNGANHIPYFL